MMQQHQEESGNLRLREWVRDLIVSLPTTTNWTEQQLNAYVGHCMNDMEKVLREKLAKDGLR